MRLSVSDKLAHDHKNRLVEAPTLIYSWNVGQEAQPVSPTFTVGPIQKQADMLGCPWRSYTTNGTKNPNITGSFLVSNFLGPADGLALNWLALGREPGSMLVNAPCIVVFHGLEGGDDSAGGGWPPTGILNFIGLREFDPADPNHQGFAKFVASKSSPELLSETDTNAMVGLMLHYSDPIGSVRPFRKAKPVFANAAGTTTVDTATISTSAADAAIYGVPAYTTAASGANQYGLPCGLQVGSQAVPRTLGIYLNGSKFQILDGGSTSGHKGLFRVHSPVDTLHFDYNRYSYEVMLATIAMTTFTAANSFELHLQGVDIYRSPHLQLPAGEIVRL